MEEIIKTFTHSSPGPKSEVHGQEQIKRESGGKISYRDKCMYIARNNYNKG